MVKLQKVKTHESDARAAHFVQYINVVAVLLHFILSRHTINPNLAKGTHVKHGLQ